MPIIEIADVERMYQCCQSVLFSVEALQLQHALNTRMMLDHGEWLRRDLKLLFPLSAISNTGYGFVGSIGSFAGYN